MKGRGDGVVGRSKVSSLKVKVPKNATKRHGLALSGFAAEAEGGGSGSGHLCGECGKIFKSRKAMYGHMRAHPERRRRRGFKNPAGAAGAGPSSGPTGSPSGNADWVGSEEMEAVSVMLMIAEGPCSSASVSPRRGAIESMEVDTWTDATMEEAEENASQSRNPLASLDLNQLPGFAERGSSSGCSHPVGALVLDLGLGL